MSCFVLSGTTGCCGGRRPVSFFDGKGSRLASETEQRNADLHGGLARRSRHGVSRHEVRRSLFLAT